MSDLISDPKKGMAAYRAVVGVCSLLGTIGISIIIGYAKSADSKLSRIDGDVAQIKWEIPVIKRDQQSDKMEMLRQIHNMEQRLQSLRDLYDTGSSENNKLKTDVALLKQKAQIP